MDLRRPSDISPIPADDDLVQPTYLVSVFSIKPKVNLEPNIPPPLIHSAQSPPAIIWRAKSAPPGQTVNAPHSKRPHP